MKHEIVRELNGIGTWDLEIENGEPGEKNIYSHNFRKSLGYENEADFPNVFESWVNTVAPDEVEKVTHVFQEHYSGDTRKPPVATSEEIEWADAIIFSVPTRFGNIASQMKQFLDTQGGIWANGNCK